MMETRGPDAGVVEVSTPARHSNSGDDGLAGCLHPRSNARRWTLDASMTPPRMRQKPRAGSEERARRRREDMMVLKKEEMGDRASLLYGRGRG